MKAVVLEKCGSSYSVLGQDGTFRHVHRRLNAEVGEEVQIQSWMRTKNTSLQKFGELVLNSLRNSQLLH